MTALEITKSVEQYESLILIMDDLDAQKLMAAWQLYRPAFTDRAVRKGETVDDLWEKLWESVEPIQYKKLSDDSGVPYATVCVLFRRLMNARLIYPDGTISPNAKKLLTTAVGGNIAGLVPSRWNKPPVSGKTAEPPKPAAAPAKAAKR